MTQLQNDGPVESLDQGLRSTIRVESQDLGPMRHVGFVRRDAARDMKGPVLAQEPFLERFQQKLLDLRSIGLDAIGLEPRHLEIAGEGLFAEALAVDRRDFEGRPRAVRMIDHFRSPPLKPARRREDENVSTLRAHGQADDKLIEILRKYGIAGLIGGGAASALPSPAEARAR